ncbi:MAG TPA: LptE family protein [Bryobacteraceae bacterium]|nr:LptE family protein [Bryobacteraceae bacterium]
MSCSKFGALAACMLLTGCGYHVAGHADLLPKNIKTIAVPAWSNVTAEYQLTDQIPEAISREFISRTRYTVVADPKEADAVVKGAITNYFAYPIVTDQTSGRATGVEMMVTLQVYLYDRAGKELYSRPSFVLREQYEVAVNPQHYFDESPAALARLSGDAAREIVSGILEKF